MQIKLAQTDTEIDACFPVMVQLRPHLVAAEFSSIVRLQAQETGYRLAYVETEAGVVAVAGFIIRHLLSAGRVLYVDDLVTDAAYRSGGYGAALYAWLEAFARAAACDRLDLDSGVQRFDAHRFYFRQGMHIFAYHFRQTLS